MIERALRPGWSERQYEKAKTDMETWPAWMRPSLNCKESCGGHLDATDEGQMIDPTTKTGGHQ